MTIDDKALAWQGDDLIHGFSILPIYGQNGNDRKYPYICIMSMGYFCIFGVYMK